MGASWPFWWAAELLKAASLIGLVLAPSFRLCLGSSLDPLSVFLRGSAVCVAASLVSIPLVVPAVVV